MFKKLKCRLGLHDMPEDPTNEVAEGACVTICHFECRQGCGHVETVRIADHTFVEGFCLYCGLEEPRRTYVSSRLTSEIEKDPEADPHEWLGSDINLRR